MHLTTFLFKRIIDPLNSQTSQPLTLPPINKTISPTRTFCFNLYKKYGIAIKGVATDYILPRGLNAKQAEDWLIQDKYTTNAGIQLHHRPFLGQFDGIKRYVTFTPAPQSGEAVEPRTKELRDFVLELKALNPKKLHFVRPEELGISPLFNIIWGCICSINPYDIKTFCLRSEPICRTKKGRMKRLELKSTLENECGIKINWQPSYATLKLIDRQFSQCEKIRPKEDAPIFRVLHLGT